MFSTRIRRLVQQQWAGLIALFLVLTGGSAWALDGQNTVFTDDIVDGQVKSADIGTGEVGEADVGQGAVASAEVRNGALVGADVGDNALKGVDIDESTLTNIGGGGPAGGDLTGSYPNPEIAFRAVGADELANLSVGFNKLTDVRIEHNAASIPAGGGVGSVRINCPAGSVALAGGARFDFRSGDLASSFGDLGGWTAEGQNNGTADQNLTASVLCLGL